MFIAATVRPGTLVCAHRYSPKTPQKIWRGGKSRVRSVTQIWKPALPASDFRSAPSPTGAVSKRGLRSATGDGSGEALCWGDGGSDGGYLEHRIGTTDDLQDADGVAVLDYAQAQNAAREWWRAETRREEGHDTRQGPLTVADAMAEYLKAYERRGGKAVYETQRAADTHIVPALGTTPVGKLTARKIADWHHGLAEKRARVRTKPGRTQNYRKASYRPRRRSQAPRHRKPHSHGPEGRIQSRLEGGPRRGAMTHGVGCSHSRGWRQRSFAIFRRPNVCGSLTPVSRRSAI